MNGRILLLERPTIVLTQPGATADVELTCTSFLNQRSRCGIFLADQGGNFEGRQLKIDVLGDGRNNIGVPPSIPRQEANALEIVINGLPILTYTGSDSHGLDTYYREKIILGPGAFVEIANDYDDFARAFLRKLRRELTPLVSQENAAPRALIQETHAR